MAPPTLDRPTTERPTTERPTTERPARERVVDLTDATPSEARRARRAKSGSRIGIPRWARHLGLAVALVVVGGLVGVLPFRTRSVQQDSYQQSTDRLTKLQAENKALKDQRDLLNTDEEISRLAREEFGLAPDGSTVYAIPGLRPDNTDRTRTAATPTQPAKPAPKQGLFSKIVDTLVFWD